MEKNDMATTVTAVYCRVAHDDDTVLESQERLLRRFAEEMGIGKCTFYADNGYSGINLNRPAFSEMNRDIQDGKIRAVIVKDHAKIARNTFLVAEWLDNMEKLCVPVIVYDFPDNELQAKIRASLAASYNEKRERRRRNEV